MPYQLQYIGANWWRWPQLTELVGAAREAGLDRLRVCGRWWDGEIDPDYPQATANEPGWLTTHGVEVVPPVPFGRVVTEMARSAIHPILARPVLSQMGLLTPRMFETLAAGTLIVLPDELGYLTALYGEKITQFQLEDDPGGLLQRMLADPKPYRQQLAEIQQEVYARFNYRRVLTDLITLLS